MLPEKPYALSCDKNSDPILNVLKEYLPGCQSLLELGAGTAQHAIYMAPHFSHLTWTLADLEDRHEGMKMWLKDFPRRNIQGPLLYDMAGDGLPEGDYDSVFTSNTIHIVSWDLALNFFDHLKSLPQNAFVFIYGAFNYGGQFTTESNKDFNAWILERFPDGGIRDFEKVESELKSREFQLVRDHEMPANNRLLVFQKQ